MAYWQLLLMGKEVEDLSPAWYPAQRDSENQAILTPGQVQRGAGRFIAKLGASCPEPQEKVEGEQKAINQPRENAMEWFAKGKMTPKGLLQPLKRVASQQNHSSIGVLPKTSVFVYHIR